jgi:ATP-dependent RNA helicase RhlB
MPKKLLNKVRSILKKEKKGADPVQAPKAEPKAKVETPAAPPAKKEAKPAAPRRKPLKEESADQVPMPEPVEMMKKRRAPEPEEWRPGKGSSYKKEEAASGETSGEKSRPPRQNRSRNSSSRPRSDEKDGERRERKPRSKSGQSKSGQGRSRSDSNRGGERRSNARPGSTRGKGFAFPRAKPDAGDWKREDYLVEPEEGKTRFLDMDLPDELLHAISDLGYKYGTPIQSGILPELMKGRDGMGQAQTGTGKTAAFLLASLSRMLRDPKPDLPNGSPRMLILAPTRELVLQIEEEAAELTKYTPFQSLPVYGGLDYEPQKEALRHHRVDIVSATPGRLIDFMRSRVIDLSQVEILVLDEADRMLDMGFIPDVKRIVYATPHKDKRQTLFFSATFTDDIRRLAQSWTRDPASVIIEPESVAADTVDQTVFIVTDDQKFALTVNMLRNFQPSRTLIFANRRDTSQDLCDHLNAYGFTAALLSGAVPQGKRVKTLEAFKDGSMPVVVATDVAGRGIHVDDVGLVINYNLPEDPEDYVHRIGRTGRAGIEGKSVCFASEFDSMMLPDIEKFIGRELTCTRPDEEWLEVEKRDVPRRQRSSGGGGRGRSGGGGGRGRPGGGGGGRGRSGGGRSSGGRR